MSAPILLADPDNREEWLARRRSGIGASEIAAVMGISPWDSPFSLYWKKVNGWTSDANEGMRDGQHLEPAICSWWEATQDPNENLSIQPGRLFAHPLRPWQIATPDRLISLVCASCDGTGRDGSSPDTHFQCWDCRATGAGGPVLAVMDAKWAPGGWDGWGEPGTDDIPPYYRAQLLWQCDVMGVDEWHLAALGHGGFRSYRGVRDEADLELMRKAGAEFMARIEAGDPPPLDDHSATLAAVKRLHPDLTDTTAEIAEDVATEYRDACRAVREAERRKDGAEAKLRAAMGDAARAEHAGAFVASRSIFEVAESVRRAYTVDRLNPARERKASAGTT